MFMNLGPQMADISMNNWKGVILNAGPYGDSSIRMHTSASSGVTFTSTLDLWPLTLTFVIDPWPQTNWEKRFLFIQKMCQFLMVRCTLSLWAFDCDRKGVVSWCLMCTSLRISFNGNLMFSFWPPASLQVGWLPAAAGSGACSERRENEWVCCASECAVCVSDQLLSLIVLSKCMWVHISSFSTAGTPIDSC